MNDKPGMDNGLNPFVALSGRVPCKVLGPVKKGDRLVTTDIEGVASSAGALPTSPYSVLGRSLEDKTSMDIGLIEITVGRL